MDDETRKPADDEKPAEYEPPAADDLETEEKPSATAAGGTQTNGTNGG